jgi:hypothetical protein
MNESVIASMTNLETKIQILLNQSLYDLISQESLIRKNYKVQIAK